MVDKTGTPENDTLLGTAGADLLIGLAGDDSLQGLGGGDVLRGGAGNDELRGDGGPDDLRGGRGDDDLEGGGGRDVLLGGRGDDILIGDNGADDLRGGSGEDILEGGDGNDLLDGGDGDDFAAYVGSSDGIVLDLEAGEAVDAAGSVDQLISIEGVLGSTHDDVILGAAGGEALFGGPGDDLIEGRLGADILSGGEGDDSFVYRDLDEGGDLIVDFQTIATADSTLSGDAIVLDDTLLEGFEPGVSDVSGFFDLVDNGSDVDFRVDADGGGDNFTTLATLVDLAGASTLVTSEVQLGDVTGIAIQIVTPDVTA